MINLTSLNETIIDKQQELIGRLQYNIDQINDAFETGMANEMNETCIEGVRAAIKDSKEYLNRYRPTIADLGMAKSLVKKDNPDKL